MSTTDYANELFQPFRFSPARYTLVAHAAVQPISSGYFGHFGHLSSLDKFGDLDDIGDAGDFGGFTNFSQFWMGLATVKFW